MRHRDGLPGEFIASRMPRGFRRAQSLPIDAADERLGVRKDVIRPLAGCTQPEAEQAASIKLRAMTFSESSGKGSYAISRQSGIVI